MTNGNSRFGSSKDILGFLVAAFAGALNIFGLKSAEVGDVLRNNSVSVSLIAALLLAGLVCAVVSIFADEKNTVWLGAAIGIIALTALCFPLVIWKISSLMSLGSHIVVVGLILIIVAILCMATIRRPVWPNLSNLQCIFLVMAIILTSAAAYGGLRLEAISQGNSFVQLGDKIQIMGKSDTLAVSIAASKLSIRQWVSVRILGVPRKGISIQADCKKVPKKLLNVGAKKAGVNCNTDPCYYFDTGLKRKCTPISSDIFPPDSSGTVRQTFTIAFLPVKYQHLQLYAVVCNPAVVKGIPTGACELSNNPTSRLDQDVPLGHR
jgi:hypothetical protein